MIKSILKKINTNYLKFLTVFWAITIAESANAQSGGGSQQSIWLQILPLLLIFVVFFLLVILPQQRKAKKHREMVNNLSKGEEVITSSGIFGKISKVNDDQRSIMLEISDKTQIKVTKESIAHIIKPANAKK